MKISYNWLQTFFDDNLPEPKKLEEILTYHSFEVEEIIEKEGDTIFDLDILSNRAHDCLSHRGIAREISAILDVPIKRDPLKERGGDFEDKLLNNSSKEIFLDIESPELCLRYSSAVIKNTKAVESPNWLKERLKAIDQRSINSIVDVANYVMFELGQPLHVFDMDKLAVDEKGKKTIKARSAKAGEKMITLENEEYEFEGGELLIVDGVDDRILGIAGIKGGKEAEIDENTKNIILESANFDPISIRITSNKLALKTDASKRFEYAITPHFTGEVLLEVVDLILKISGGEVEGYKDVYPRPSNPYNLGVSLEKINSVLGLELGYSDVENIFNRLNFSYEILNPRERVVDESQKYSDANYKYGASVTYDAPLFFDCSSFVSFVFSRAGIQVPRISIDQFFYGSEIKEEKDLLPGDLVFSNSNKIVEGKIYYESVEFLKGFELKAGVDHVGIYLGKGKIIHASRKLNGVGIENLKESDSFSNVVGCRRVIDKEKMFKVVAPRERLDLKRPEDLIEEVGRVYGYVNIEEKSLGKNEKYEKNYDVFYAIEFLKDILFENGFSEIQTYVFEEEGDIETQNPIASDKAFLRKTLVNGMRKSLDLNTRNSEILGIDQIKIFEIGKAFKKEKEFNSLCIAVKDVKKQSEVKGEVKAIEFFENIFQKLKNKTGYDIKPVFFEKEDGNIQYIIAEIDLDQFLDNLSCSLEYEPKIEERDVLFERISPYPYVLRDIAVWMPEGSSSDELISLIMEKGGDMIINHKLFDEYHKDGKVSFAFRLVFQSKEKTLSDEEVNVVMDGIYKEIENKSWEVR